MAVVSVLEARRSTISAALTSTGNRELVSILDHDRPSYGQDELPLIAVEITGESGQWQALPNIARLVFEFDVVIMLNHDVIPIRRSGIRRMAGAVRDALNERHLPISVQGKVVELYPHEEGSTPPTPVRAIQYGERRLEASLVDCAVLKYVICACEGVPDSSDYHAN